MPHVRTVIDVGKESWAEPPPVRPAVSRTGRHDAEALLPVEFVFRAVVRHVAADAPVDWADVAVAGGYYDQAHLAHEFHDFAGISPSRYRAGRAAVRESRPYRLSAASVGAPLPIPTRRIR